MNQAGHFIAVVVCMHVNILKLYNCLFNRSSINYSVYLLVVPTHGSAPVTPSREIIL